MHTQKKMQFMQAKHIPCFAEELVYIYEELIEDETKKICVF